MLFTVTVQTMFMCLLLISLYHLDAEICECCSPSLFKQCLCLLLISLYHLDAEICECCSPSLFKQCLCVYYLFHCTTLMLRYVNVVHRHCSNNVCYLFHCTTLMLRYVNVVHRHCSNNVYVFITYFIVPP